MLPKGKGPTVEKQNAGFDHNPKRVCPAFSKACTLSELYANSPTNRILSD